MWPDGWTAVTSDGKRSAQFEHTLLVRNFKLVLFSQFNTFPAIILFCGNAYKHTKYQLSWWVCTRIPVNILLLI
jgi:hypothetical protein